MKTLSLNGTWSCTLPDGSSCNQEVPGCWETEIDSKTITGPVICKRNITVALDREFGYYLHFEAVSYWCRILVNGSVAGTHEGMWDAFTIPVTEYLVHGLNNICVEIVKPGYSESDQFPVREVLSGFIPDVLSTFGGIWDDVSLVASPVGFVEYHYVRGTADGSYTLTAEVLPLSERIDLEYSWKIFDADGVLLDTGSKPMKGCLIDVKGKIAAIETWDPHHPTLYGYELSISDGKCNETVCGSFGFRTIAYDTSTLLLNRKPIHIHGVLHWGYYDTLFRPKPTDNMIADEIRGVQDYGFNAMKHCLYIPSQEYLDAADREGLMVWVEFPLWLPVDKGELEKRIRREYPRMIRKIAGHPSVLLTTIGCELNTVASGRILQDMYDLLKTETDTLVRDNSGSGDCYEGLHVDYADFWDYHFYSDLHQMEDLLKTFTPSWRMNRPWLFGEFCDSDTLRDMDEIRKVHAVNTLQWESEDPDRNPLVTLKPDFFLGSYEKDIRESGIKERLPLLYERSCHHSQLVRKYIIEQSRAFGEISGYNITAIRDIPLSPIGIWDDLGRPKFDQKVFNEFNDDAVLLPQWDLSRVWTNFDLVKYSERYNFFSGDISRTTVVLSSYRNESIIPKELSYTVTNSAGKIIYAGTAQAAAPIYKVGEVRKLTTIEFRLPASDTSEDYLLRVKLIPEEGEPITNAWPLFSYPAPQQKPLVHLHDPAHICRGITEICDIDADLLDSKSIIIASALNEELLEHVRAGKTMIYIQRGQGTLPSRQVAFWREGFSIREKDELLDELSYSSYLDELRYYSVGTDTALIPEECAAVGLGEYVPLIRRYDCRQHHASDYLAEFRLGEGRIIATTLRLECGVGTQPYDMASSPFSIWFINKVFSTVAKEKS